MLNVEYVNSNGFIQRVLAKVPTICQALCWKLWYEESPLCCERADSAVFRVGVGMEREKNIKLTLLHYGKYSNKGAYKYRGDPGRDRLAYPREKSENAS